jgi:hypothetical protein
LIVIWQDWRKHCGRSGGFCPPGYVRGLAGPVDPLSQEGADLVADFNPLAAHGAAARASCLHRRYLRVTFPAAIPPGCPALNS